MIAYNLKPLKKLFIILVSLIHISVVILILSKASVNSYSRKKTPLFPLSDLKVQQLQRIRL